MSKASLLELCHGEKKYVILNKQVKILTSLCIGTCKSAYTKGLCPKLCTNLTIVPVKEKIITI